jgi:peptidoglycan/LPS O-acetylase OafA/YrhL
MDFPGLTFRGVLVSFCFGLFGLPSDVVPQHQALFAVNGPCWSLFFEFWVANVVFVLFRKKLGLKALLTLVFVCGVGLVATEKAYYTVSVGWGWNNFAPGFVRVGFSFFAGVALARYHAARPPKLKLPSWFFILALPVLLSLPLAGRLSHRYELICVFVLFPALIYWGAAAFERRPWFGAALGDASYAMYVIHDPLWVLCSWLVSRMAIQQGFVPQLIFVLGIAGLSWGLNIADTRARIILMSRVRAWRHSPSRAGGYLPVDRRVAEKSDELSLSWVAWSGEGKTPTTSPTTDVAD